MAIAAYLPGTGQAVCVTMLLVTQVTEQPLATLVTMLQGSVTLLGVSLLAALVGLTAQFCTTGLEGTLVAARTEVYVKPARAQESAEDSPRTTAS